MGTIKDAFQTKTGGNIAARLDGMCLIKRRPGGGTAVEEVIHHCPLCVSTLMEFLQQQQSEIYSEVLNVQEAETLAWGPLY